jgi:hypothetical protein
MLINSDLSSDNLALSLQQKRSEPSGATNQASSATPPASTASQLDPLLQRLTEAPAPIEDGGMEIHDESSAMQAMNSLLQGIRSQPGTAMSAQANQLSANVLSLLQPAD